MEQYWSKKAREIAPYVAGEQPKEKNIIKLNTNENPYPPSPGVLMALKGIHERQLRLYPDPNCDVLRSAIAARHGVTPDMVFVGNGSDDVLSIAFQSFFDGGLLFPDVTYSFYPVWASLYDISYARIPLRDDFTIDVSGYSGGQCAVIANPNAPTSIALSLSEIKKMASGLSGAFIVDEAYAEFGADSAVPLISSHPNIVVVRTLSKSHALAGLRLGYAIGAPGMIEAMNRIKDSVNSYPVDAIAQRLALAAVTDDAYTKSVVEQIAATRERIAAALLDMGFTVLPSRSNFIFAGRGPLPARDIMPKLREQGVIVRYFPGGRTDDFLRITVGTDQQMDEFLKKLNKILY